MEKIREANLIKRHGFIAFVSIMLMSFMISLSHGEENTRVKYGFSVFGGTGDAWHNKTDLTVYGFLPRVDVPLHRNWDLEFEGNYSYWNIRREHDFYFLGVDANLIFKPIRRTWGSVFLLGGGGLGYDSAGKRVRQIGDSHCGGILQAGVGVYYYLGKKWALRVEYRFYHTSEPFRTDGGLNAHAAFLGISF